MISRCLQATRRVHGCLRPCGTEPRETLRDDPSGTRPPFQDRRWRQAVRTSVLSRYPRAALRQLPLRPSLQPSRSAPGGGAPGPPSSGLMSQHSWRSHSNPSGKSVALTTGQIGRPTALAPLLKSSSRLAAVVSCPEANPTGVQGYQQNPQHPCNGSNDRDTATLFQTNHQEHLVGERTHHPSAPAT